MYSTLFRQFWDTDVSKSVGYFGEFFVPQILLDRLNYRITQRERLAMPRKTGKSKTLDYGDTWFVRCRLGNADKADFEKWYEANLDDAELFVDNAIRQSLKLSVTFSTHNDAFCASYTCKAEDSPNYGGVLTSWADNWHEAVFMGLYKIFVILADNEWPKEDGKQDWG
jgi:hypothetical protein